jgi:WD40 repeat protein
LVFGGEYKKRESAIRVLELASNQISTIPGSEGLFSPRWSPDGHSLAALSADAKKLVLYDFAVRKWHDLATVEATAAYFSWSRDGQHISFSARGTEPAFERISVHGEHRMEELVSLKDVRLFNGMFGSWTGFAPDDSPLVLRDTSSDEIYALDVLLP